MQASSEWNFSVISEEALLYEGFFPWKRLEAKNNSRTFMSAHAANLCQLIRNYGWDTTSELIGMVWDSETIKEIDLISSTKTNEAERKLAFENFITNPAADFTLSIISGGHRFAALSQLHKEQFVDIPDMVRVRVLTNLDDLSMTFSFLSQRSNDNQHVTQPQMLIDRINQIHKLYNYQVVSSGGKKITQQEAFKARV